MSIWNTSHLYNNPNWFGENENALQKHGLRKSFDGNVNSKLIQLSGSHSWPSVNAKTNHQWNVLENCMIRFMLLIDWLDVHVFCDAFFSRPVQLNIFISNEHISNLKPSYFILFVRIDNNLGTGSNACYVEKVENAENFEGETNKSHVLINT